MSNLAVELMYSEIFEDSSAITFTYKTAYDGYISGSYVNSKLTVDSPLNKNGKPSACKRHIKEAKEDMMARIKNFKESSPEWFKAHRKMYKVSLTNY